VKNGIPFSQPIHNKDMEERSLQTLKDMLIARGIKDEKFEPVGNPMNETRMYTFGGVLVVFSEKTRITIQELGNMLNFASENKFTGGMIIVTPTNPSDSVLEIVREHISNKENQLVQIFYQSHLNFDISKHEKVPKHRILTEAEVQEVMKEFHIVDIKKIPKIDSQDPMAKWIGARPGDVVEVTGMCLASGENKRYRYCLANVYET
jgi:DNA-directed RNA polymerases I, II, and III subunit RPABC1